MASPCFRSVQHTVALDAGGYLQLFGHRMHQKSFAAKYPERGNTPACESLFYSRRWLHFPSAVVASNAPPEGMHVCCLPQNTSIAAAEMSVASFQHGYGRSLAQPTQPAAFGFSPLP